MIQRNDLTATWIKYHQNKLDDDFWAFEELNDLACDSPFDAWECIKDIFDQTSSESVLKNLAAGPLEELLFYHGASIIDELEILSRQNPLFAKLVKGVWSGEMPINIQAKVNEIQIKYGNSV